MLRALTTHDQNIQNIQNIKHFLFAIKPAKKHTYSTAHILHIRAIAYSYSTKSH